MMIQDNFKVDAIITDPPYNISKKNNFKTIGRNGIDFGEWDKSFNQILWLEKIDQILKEGGSIIIFNDWKNLGTIAKKLETLNFEIKDILRWIKPNPMPRNINRRYVTDYEFALWATKKNGKWTFNKKTSKPYIRPEFVASIVSSKNRIHPTEKPISLIEEIINIHTNEGDIIFDPFSGSGSISYVANKLNRFYIASEISKTYYDQSLKRIKELYTKPAFNHLGNKYRMIEDLSREFPRRNIDYFVEVFAGSGVASLNYKTPQKAFINDNDKWLTKILNYLMNTNVDIVVKKTEQIIKKYNLPTNKTNFNYKEDYKKLKHDFNKQKNIEKLLVLILYGFNQQIRFNSNEEWNIPAGKFYWNSYQRNKLIDYCKKAREKTYAIYSMDFKDFVAEIKSEVDKDKTIFYFDPPYLISNATYNKFWSEEKEKELIQLLLELTQQGYKWILSNVIESKGIQNKILLQFINNTENVFYELITNVNYSNSNYQRKKTQNEDKEILVKGNL